MTAQACFLVDWLTNWVKDAPGKACRTFDKSLNKYDFSGKWHTSVLSI